MFEEVCKKCPVAVSENACRLVLYQLVGKGEVRHLNSCRVVKS